jgi:hypothetical protein
MQLLNNIFVTDNKESTPENRDREQIEQDPLQKAENSA